MSMTTQTPASAGFAMPAEWDEHQRCLMSWPTRVELWDGRLDEAKRDYAAVARAIVAFEPLTMVCAPGSEQEVRDHCGDEVDVLIAPIDDSWIRDNGPVFVRDDAGRLAAVNFRFNAWGERWHPYDSDDALPHRIAEYLDVPLFDAPLVLEGGSYFVDGEGTLITTEQCLLNPNRNPDLDRAEIEALLKANLGVSSIVWLPYGHTLDVGPAGTDGHVDGIAQYVAPGRIVLEVPSREDASEYATSQANLAALDGVRDARGRALEVECLDPGLMDVVAYCNFYLANDAVIVPVIGDSRDDQPLEQLARIYPDRKVVGVAGEVIAAGGGGPHCITQQVPAGTLGGR
jgi:agmatine deiminase